VEFKIAALRFFKQRNTDTCSHNGASAIAHRAQQCCRQDHIDAWAVCFPVSTVNPVCNDLAAYDWQMKLQCPLSSTTRSDQMLTVQMVISILKTGRS
jgi:hypothetical protein